MNRVLSFTSVGEAATGLLLIVYPPIAVRLLFGAEISGAGVIMCRIAGIALIGLGVACWSSNSAFKPINRMLAYGMLAMLYLGYIGVHGEFAGALLWPAVVADLILTVLLGNAWLRQHPKDSVAISAQFAQLPDGTNQPRRHHHD